VLRVAGGGVRPGVGGGGVCGFPCPGVGGGGGEGFGAPPLPGGANAESGTSFFTTFGSSGVGTVVSSPPLPPVTTGSLVDHSWPCVKIVPLTTTRTEYWNFGTKDGCPV